MGKPLSPRPVGGSGQGSVAHRFLKQGHGGNLVSPCRHVLCTPRRHTIWKHQPTLAAGDGQRLARLAAERGYDLVVAAGGDGTINEVINAATAAFRAAAESAMTATRQAP